VVFFSASLGILCLFATSSFDPREHRFEWTRPLVYSGDEPHYLIIISSILLDGDLSLANNYHSVRVGGMDAGRKFSGQNLDHHTLIHDVRTGETAIWDKIFAPGTPECDRSTPSCVGYQRVSKQFPDYTLDNPAYEERPEHAIPFPALIAFMLKQIGAGRNQAEADAIYAQVFLAWLAGVLTYACALKAGLGPKGSIVGVSLVYFASPWPVYSHELFPQIFLGLLLVAALWAFISLRVVMAAACLTIAGMQSEVFILILPAWVLFLYFSNEKRRALRFALAGFVFLIATALMNRILLGMVSIRYIWFSFDPVLWSTFTNWSWGLWLFVPWSVAAFSFLIFSFFHRGENVNTLRTIALGICPAAIVYMMIFNVGGDCYGPRYWVPYMPWLSIALVLGARRVWQIRPLLIRPVLVILVGLSLVISVTAAIVSPTAVPFWMKPPWYASKVLFAAHHEDYTELVSPSNDLDLWLGSGCTARTRDKVTANPPTPVKSTDIILVSRLACSSQIADGAEVARLRITDTGGNVQIRSVVAGRDSSEWAYDCPAVNPAMQHQRAKIYLSFPTIFDKPCAGHFYFTKYPLDGVKEIRSIDFEWLGPPGALIIDKIMLTNEQTNSSYHIESTAFAGPGTN
jgi:hypothetical protein